MKIKIQESQTMMQAFLYFCFMPVLSPVLQNPVVCLENMK